VVVLIETLLAPQPLHRVKWWEYLLGWIISVLSGGLAVPWLQYTRISRVSDLPILLILRENGQSFQLRWAPPE
jgi:hypothetical protein